MNRNGFWTYGNWGGSLKDWGSSVSWSGGVSWSVGVSWSSGVGWGSSVLYKNKNSFYIKLVQNLVTNRLKQFITVTYSWGSSVSWSKSWSKSGRSSAHKGQEGSDLSKPNHTHFISPQSNGNHFSRNICELFKKTISQKFSALIFQFTLIIFVVVFVSKVNSALDHLVCC